MPIYEYRCEACGNLQEAIQKMSDAPLRLCATCGEGALARVMSRTSFVLKGSGWYATDYKAQPKEAKAESSATPSPAAAATTPSATSTPASAPASSSGGTTGS
jgi:putative FmdB family regulatory protein